MGARQRRTRAETARREGRIARARGKPRSTCPYQVTPYGLGTPWQEGWDEADAMYHQDARTREEGQTQPPP